MQCVSGPVRALPYVSSVRRMFTSTVMEKAATDGAQIVARIRGSEPVLLPPDRDNELPIALIADSRLHKQSSP